MFNFLIFLLDNLLRFACSKVNITLSRPCGNLDRRFSDFAVGIEFDVHAELGCWLLQSTDIFVHTSSDTLIHWSVYHISWCHARLRFQKQESEPRHREHHLHAICLQFLRPSHCQAPRASQVRCYGWGSRLSRFGQILALVLELPQTIHYRETTHSNHGKPATVTPDFPPW